MKPTIDRRGKIVKPDHTGDTAIAEFTPGVNDERAAKAEQVLTDFFTDRQKRYGSDPRIFAKRPGATDYTPFTLGQDRVFDMETVLIQDPLCGG